jgi:hypothetical protein
MSHPKVVEGFASPARESSHVALPTQHAQGQRFTSLAAGQLRTPLTDSDLRVFRRVLSVESFTPVSGLAFVLTGPKKKTSCRLDSGHHKSFPAIHSESINFKFDGAS